MKKEVSFFSQLGCVRRIWSFVCTLISSHGHSLTSASIAGGSYAPGILVGCLSSTTWWLSVLILISFRYTSVPSHTDSQLYMGHQPVSEPAMAPQRHVAPSPLSITAHLLFLFLQFLSWLGELSSPLWPSEQPSPPSPSLSHHKPLLIFHSQYFFVQCHLFLHPACLRGFTDSRTV